MSVCPRSFTSLARAIPNGCREEDPGGTLINTLVVVVRVYANSINSYFDISRPFKFKKLKDLTGTGRKADGLSVDSIWLAQGQRSKDPQAPNLT